MKKYSLIMIKVAIGLTILLGVLIILFANEKSFRKIVADDIGNISRLSSSIIYSEIDNSLTKPIYVGLTMANDIFLKNWLLQEPKEGSNQEQTELMQQYLKGYAKKYEYDSVSVISAKSGVYYYQDGVNKTVSKENAHDVWYYNFIETHKPYDLDVDVDEANNNELTVFSNCRITDNNGNFMGVVGVGIKMTHLQEMLKSYEDEYALRAFLMDENGLIQVDSIDKNIEASNFFDNPAIVDFKDKILENKSSMETFWYVKDGGDHCLITQYIDNLDWYIVVEKNTAETQKIFSRQINKDLFLISIIIILVLLMISYIIGGYNRKMLKTASIDDVTNLPNSKMFQEIFQRNSKRAACHEGVVFLFDIDGFKKINDRFGHLIGNTVLYKISEITRKTIGNNGVVARFGGDEFIGVIYGAEQETVEIIDNIVKNIVKMIEGEINNITISLGTTSINSAAELDVMIKEADVAMYSAKQNGGNQAAAFK